MFSCNATIFVPYIVFMAATLAKTGAEQIAIKNPLIRVAFACAKAIFTLHSVLLFFLFTVHLLVKYLSRRERDVRGVQRRRQRQKRQQQRPQKQ